MKGTEMSSFPADPWMVSANNPKPDFANWVWEQNKRKRPEATLPDAKAEIRNSWVRAADLWEEFQKAIALEVAHRVALEVAQTSLVVEENDLQPGVKPGLIPFDKKAGRMALLQKINQL